MRRVVVVIVALVALTLVGGLAFLMQDDAVAPIPRPEPAPLAVGKPRKDLVAEPRRDARASAPQKAKRLPPPEQPPLAGGRLECAVSWPADHAPDQHPDCRLTVFLPRGEELATKSADGRHDFVFESLPVGVPLIVRASTSGCLTGLCCDVVLPPDRPLRKSIALLPAPSVRIRVFRAAPQRPQRDVRVSLLREGVVVAEGVTERDGRAELRVPVLGQLSVRLSAPGLVASENHVIDVWSGENEVEHRLEVRDAGTVQVVVMTASGEPAAGVPVWLLGDANDAPSALTDRTGTVRFAGLRSGLGLAAVARSSDGGVARAEVMVFGGPASSVPLVLGKAGPLVGDVVDQGGAAIRGARVEVRVLPFDEVVTATSDDSGMFSTVPLPAGLVNVTVRCDGFAEWRSEQPTVVEPAIGGRLRARLRRDVVGALVASVRDATGAPIAGATVTLYPSRRTATTAADGRCRFDDLPAGLDQSVVARRRGFRAVRNLDPSALTVRVPADEAVAAETVLVPVGDAQAHVGPTSVVGLVLDPSSRPVLGARVEAVAVAAFTGPDGRFRLDGLPAPASGEPVEVRVTPDAIGMLEPFRCFVDLHEADSVDFGTVRLRRRPFARINVLDRTFWLSCNHADVLLGRVTQPFEPIACVSYDGTWMHLPPPDDWRREGRGEVFVASSEGRGLLVAQAAWTLAPDATATLDPAVSSRSGRVHLGRPDGYRNCDVTFTQVACGAQYDPRSIHVPTGDAPLPIDPFAGLASRRTFTLAAGDVKSSIDDLAPGRWLVKLVSAGTKRGNAETLSGSVVVPDESTVKYER